MSAPFQLRGFLNWNPSIACRPSVSLGLCPFASCPTCPTLPPALPWSQLQFSPPHLLPSLEGKITSSSYELFRERSYTILAKRVRNTQGKLNLCYLFDLYFFPYNSHSLSSRSFVLVKYALSHLLKKNRSHPGLNTASSFCHLPPFRGSASGDLHLFVPLLSHDANCSCLTHLPPRDK